MPGTPGTRPVATSAATPPATSTIATARTRTRRRVMAEPPVPGAPETQEGTPGRMYSPACLRAYCLRPCAGSGRRDGSGLLNADVDLAALELDGAVLEGEDRVVLAEADVVA